MNDLAQANNEYLDYWFQYSKYICFPRTPNTYRKIGNFILYSSVPDENHKENYGLYVGYFGNDVVLKTLFNSIIKKKQQYRSSGVIPNTMFVEGNEMFLFGNVNFIKNETPKNCYYKDLIRYIEYEAGHGYRPSRFSSAPRNQPRIKNNDFVNFVKFMEKDGKTFRTIKTKEFKNKFGKTLDEYLQEIEDEKEFQKSVVYSTLVGEAYCTLERLRDECDAIMKGLQDGRHGYDMDRYKTFRNEIMAYNKYLGRNNEFIKTLTKKGSIRRQTLIMFLRENAKKSIKKK